MRTAIRTVPYDSNKYPKVHDLPRAGRLDDFYRHEIDKGRSYRQFVWGCPIEAIDSSNISGGLRKNFKMVNAINTVTLSAIVTGLSRHEV